MYELFWISGSPFAWSAMLGMEIKGLAYESRSLNAEKREHKSAAYLSMNPHGKVPLLKDGDTVIYESIAILAYLERKHPSPPLFGTTPEETGHIWQRISEIENYVRGPIATGIVVPLFQGQATGDADGIRNAVGPAQEALSWVENSLADTPYLAGETISAADAVCLPIVLSLVRAAGREDASALDLGLLPFTKTRPNIAEWIKRIEALPAFDKTYPPHWRK